MENDELDALAELFASRQIDLADPSILRTGLLPCRVAGQPPKGKSMSLKLATPVMQDGTALIKGNPLRGNYSISPDEEFTQAHFGLDQTIDARGGPEAAENSLRSV